MHVHGNRAVVVVSETCYGALEIVGSITITTSTTTTTTSCRVTTPPATNCRWQTSSVWTIPFVTSSPLRRSANNAARVSSVSPPGGAASSTGGGGGPGGGGGGGAGAPADDDDGQHDESQTQPYMHTHTHRHTDWLALMFAKINSFHYITKQMHYRF